MDGILQSTFSPLLQYGVLGINTIVFAVVIYYLWTSGNKERGLLMTQITTLQDARVASEHALQTARVASEREIHEARVADYKVVQGTLLEVTRQSTAAVAAATSAVEAMRETMLDTKATLKELGDELRHRRS
jgi:hypothetical protein